MSDMLDGKRKFGIASFILLVVAGGLFTDKIHEAAFVTVVTLVLGLYSAANITDKKLGGAG